MGSILVDDHLEGSLAPIVRLAHNIESLIFIGEVSKGVITGYHGDFLTTVSYQDARAYAHHYSAIPSHAAHRKV